MQLYQSHAFIFEYARQLGEQLARHRAAARATESDGAGANGGSNRDGDSDDGGGGGGGRLESAAWRLAQERECRAGRDHKQESESPEEIGLYGDINWISNLVIAIAIWKMRQSLDWLEARRRTVIGG